jgi:hypothetical protein
LQRPHRAPATTSVESDNRTRGPALPKSVLLDKETWHPRTVAWWATWRKSAQAKTFCGTDWDFLLDTALMHHVMWSKGRWEFAAEIRLRVAKLGATSEDRKRLHMRIDAPTKSTPLAAGNITSISERRKRLVSNDGTDGN